MPPTNHLIAKHRLNLNLAPDCENASSGPITRRLFGASRSRRLRRHRIGACADFHSTVFSVSQLGRQRARRNPGSSWGHRAGPRALPKSSHRERVRPAVPHTRTPFWGADKVPTVERMESRVGTCAAPPALCAWTTRTALKLELGRTVARVRVRVLHGLPPLRGVVGRARSRHARAREAT